MRFYQQQHQFYCGIDLHARSMCLCIRDQGGTVLLHKNLPAEADDFLLAIAPYRVRRLTQVIRPTCVRG